MCSTAVYILANTALQKVHGFFRMAILDWTHQKKKKCGLLPFWPVPCIIPTSKRGLLIEYPRPCWYCSYYLYPRVHEKKRKRPKLPKVSEQQIRMVTFLGEFLKTGLFFSSYIYLTLVYTPCLGQKKQSG